MCVGTQTPMSTSIEHELTKRALESMIQVSSNEWFCPHTSTTHDLSMRAHRHFDKVTSFYLRPLPKYIELWLRFDCSFAFLVLLIGLLTSEGTFKRWCHLPPLHIHEDSSSRTTLFQVGGDDAARPTVFASSCASTSRTTLKAEVATEEERDARGRPALLLRMTDTAAQVPALPPISTGTAALPLRLRTTILMPHRRQHGRPTTKHQI